MINIKKETREVFWDNYLVDTELTTAEHRIHHPQKREKVMSLDEIWEGDGCIYWNIIKEEDKYRSHPCTESRRLVKGGEGRNGNITSERPAEWFSKPGRLAPLSADEWLWDSHGNESGTAEVFAFVS